MAQHDFNIANQSFPSFRTDLNNALSAINTSQSGTSRPSGAVAGTIWLDTTSATTPTLKYYDGADDISLATLDHSANTVNWLDSTVSVTGLTTTATGTVLTLSDSSLTSSVNLILQNQKEIRFSETTANGVNYVGFKAPASLSADKIWVLPSADGTAGQFLKTDGAGNLSFSSDLPTTSFTGATVETSIADSDLVLIYDDSATAVRKMTKANLVAGIGATAGQVIQVVSTTKTDSFTASGFSSWNFVDITGLSVTITPSSASNKILLLSQISGSSIAGTNSMYYRVQKNSSTITGYLGDADGGSYTLASVQATGSSQYGVDANATLVYLDSPSSTSALTYKIQTTSNNNIAINRSLDGENSNNRPRTASTITVMEIKG
jgi:hypothetical protein